MLACSVKANLESRSLALPTLEKIIAAISHMHSEVQEPFKSAYISQLE